MDATPTTLTAANAVLLRRAAWTLWALICATIVVGLVAWLALGQPTPPIRFIASAGGNATVPAAIIYSFAFGTIGLLLATQRPRNAIGWIFFGVGLAMALNALANHYIASAIAAGTLQPTHEVLAWFLSSFHLPFVGVLLIAFLVVFPHGRISARLSLTGVLTIGSAALAVLSGAVHPGSVFWYPAIRNPFAVPTEFGAVVTTVAIIALLGSIGAVVLATIGIYGRYRNATGDERRQFQWIAYAGCLLAVSAVPFVVLSYAVRDADVLGTLIPICMLAATLLPLATAFAVLRYRLYDIDIIINRTLVYAVLTGVLGGAFAGLIALLQRLSVALTGDESDAALVLTTLIVASLVTPVRKAIESVVDQRFEPARAVVATTDFDPTATSPIASIERQLAILTVRIDRVEGRLGDGDGHETRATRRSGRTGARRERAD